VVKAKSKSHIILKKTDFLKMFEIAAQASIEPRIKGIRHESLIIGLVMFYLVLGIYFFTTRDFFGVTRLVMEKITPAEKIIQALGLWANMYIFLGFAEIGATLLSVGGLAVGREKIFEAFGEEVRYRTMFIISSLFAGLAPLVVVLFLHFVSPLY